MNNNILFIRGTPDNIEDGVTELRKALNEGYEIVRCYTTDNAFLMHIAEVEEDEAVEEPMIESVVEIALDDDPDTVKKWTDDGWIVKTFYSKKVQLVKMKEEKDGEV